MSLKVEHVKQVDYNKFDVSLRYCPENGLEQLDGKTRLFSVNSSTENEAVKIARQKWHYEYKNKALA